MWFRQTHGVRLTVGRSGAVPARSRAAAGKDPEREGGRDGRAGDAPLDRASTTVGVWTRAVTSPRLDRPHQLDGAQLVPAVASHGSPFAASRSRRRVSAALRDAPLRASGLLAARA